MNQYSTENLPIYLQLSHVSHYNLQQDKLNYWNLLVNYNYVFIVKFVYITLRLQSNEATVALSNTSIGAVRQLYTDCWMSQPPDGEVWDWKLEPPTCFHDTHV